MTTVDSSPVSPSTRSATLDTIRGVAVLGILVMNIGYFALPHEVVEIPAEFGGLSDWDRWSWYLQTMFFDGRMRGLFSMLFGVGLYLQWQKAQREGYDGRFGDLWTRRCVWLVVFGMVHGYLLQWPGDILFCYGVCGLFLFPFRRLGSKALLALAVCFMAVATALVTLGSLEGVERAERYRSARAVEATGEPLDESQRRVIERFEERLEAVSFEAMEERAELRRASGWVESFSFTAGVTSKFESVILYKFLFWDAFAFMLLGLALARWGFFEGRCSTWVYAACLVLGYGVAAPWSLHFARAFAATGFAYEAAELMLPQSATYQLQRLLVALAHASVVVLLMRSRAVCGLLAPLAATGRSAFTNYILQTVVCSAVFYGWGLAWFGTLARHELMLFTVCYWVFAMAISSLWLRAFRFGPLEWGWRALVHLRRPGRRAPAGRKCDLDRRQSTRSGALDGRQ